MSRTQILALVLAGGEGTRLRPLTLYQAKPAVPFACGYRIVDFVLGNLFNSKVSSVYLLAQYMPQTLVEHVHATWRPQMRSCGYTVEVVLPEGLAPGGAFAGTADAVRCCLHLLERHNPEVVAVFAADHVYRMDVRQMAGYHLSRRADVTVAGIPVPIAQASSFGVMATDQASRLIAFQEKPKNPRPIPGQPDFVYASMGNYLFKPDVLVALLEDSARLGRMDFGRDIMPMLAHGDALQTYAYDFARNQLPGIQPYEERFYWRDVGTLDALEKARADVEGARPRFDLRNRAWPIRRDLLPSFGRLPRASAYQGDRFAA
jgi:glucose-1-phosphate adenylyltransferase